MPRWLAPLLLVPSIAVAQEPPDDYDEPLPDVGEAPGDTVGERELVASVGAALGGADATPGGLRVSGAYLYQLSDLDWFEGGLAFTFGGGGAECFRDRLDELVCDHGAADGVAADLVGGVRRFFGGNQGFRPWVRPSVGLRLLRFGDDDLTGVGALLGATGGVRARIAETVAIGGHAGVEVGGAWVSGGYGLAPQLGLAIGVTAEIALP